MPFDWINNRLSGYCSFHLDKFQIISKKPKEKHRDGKYYWPVTIHAEGTFKPCWGPITISRFCGTGEFLVYKNWKGEWTAKTK